MNLMMALIIVCLLVGAGGGYAAGYGIYQPQIQNYVVQVSNLNFRIADMEQTISSRESQISILEAAKSNLETALDIAKTEGANYKQKADNLESQLSGQQTQLTSLQTQITGEQDRLNEILGVKVTQYYRWVYQQKPWEWNLSIPLSIYDSYFEKSRPKSGAYYVNMAKDPGDDLYIDQMLQQMNSASLAGGFTEAQKLNFVIAFVQSLPYTVDSVTTPYDEYPRYPVETLFDRGGDCEDTSILVAALLDRMGYDVALLLLPGAQHVAVGVSLAGAYGSYYEYNGKKYYYLETTGDGWEIGELPPEIAGAKAIVYSLRS